MLNELTDIPEQTQIQIKDWKTNKLFQFDQLKEDPNPFN
jgi:hypothetical protein